MKKTLIALTIASALFAAEEFTPPKPRFIQEEPKTSRWLFSADFLYWTAEMEGLQYASRVVPGYRVSYNHRTGKEEVVPTERAKRIRSLTGDWEPGVRVSMGYLFDDKGWDIAANWSYFRNEPSERMVRKGNRKVNPFILPSDSFFTTSGVDAAEAHWTLLQNSAEAEVGRNFSVGETFLVRPFFGLKALSVRNKTLFEYTLTTDLFSSTAALPTKSNFMGAGPRIGSNLSYEFGKGIGLFFMGSGSVLYGKFDSSFNKIRDKKHDAKTVTAMQVQFGGQWKRTFGKNYHFGLQAAWEQNFYSNINQAMNHFILAKQETPYHEEGDLSLKGLTASCHLDF